MSNEDKIVIQLAAEPSSWYKWAGYATIMGLGISYALHPGAWIVYVLCGISFGLVYWGYECYDQFSRYYNDQQFKDLALNPNLQALFDQDKGTFQDNGGLIPRDGIQDET